MLATPDAVTTTLPVVAPDGTGTTIEPALQLVGDAVVPLKATVPGLAPKLVPVMVTFAPTIPEFGDRLVIFGNTIKLTPLLAVPFTVTTTVPVAAPEGTAATIEVGLQPMAVAAKPPNVTVLLP